jgi:DUF2905 family protein
MGQVGRTLVIVGILLIIIGGALTLLGRIPRLPGDIYVQRRGVTVYVPLATSLLLSLVLTLLLNLFFARR